jgi:deoxyribodipyrimidine photo-lyase
MTVPELRIRRMNALPPRKAGGYVLYWMTANRRGRSNFALEQAVQWAESFQKPLVIFEALRCGYLWASDRIHRFVIQGMSDNREYFSQFPITYFPYVESEAGEGKGLLESLARDACVVVTDDFPCFFLPKMLAAAAERLPVLCESVDSNGLLPMRATGQVYPTAYAFRRMLQKTLAVHLEEMPLEEPLQDVSLPSLKSLPVEVTRKWEHATKALLSASQKALAALPIDHRVTPGILNGGAFAAEARMHDFVGQKLGCYSENRNEPEKDASSGLSPYLHFGHISVHTIFQEITKTEGWSPKKLSAKANGKREGWWGMSAATEGFLDELITWRELGYNMCWQRPDFDQYESLPPWAQATLDDHSADPRDPLYNLEDLEASATHDSLWNAAQNQLVQEGRMHNYLRMLWGKKILEWAASPREALKILIHLNNKYALDGRNPNSYSGIFWCLGRYDRPWGPERPIFGKIRYMSSDNTAKKFSVKNYVKTYSRDPSNQGKLF